MDSGDTTATMMFGTKGAALEWMEAKNMRLIDADELLKTPFRITGKFGGKYPFEAITIKTVEAAPTIDPIREAGGCYCRECRWRYTPNCMVRHERADMDFCSHGLRRPDRDLDNPDLLGGKDDG